MGMHKIMNTMKTKAVTVAAFVFIAAFSLIRATHFPEGDIFWGARNGMDTLRNGVQIFQPDTWNLQTLGEEWSPNSWLWNVFLGGAYLAFDNYGFLLVTLATNVIAFSFLWGYLQKVRMPPLAAFLTLVLSMTVMAIFMNGRGNTADFMILMVFLFLCRHYLHKLLPLLVISFALTILWMNLHMTGIAAAAVFPAVAYAMLHHENTRKRLLQAALVLLSTLIALPLTPYGFEGLIKVSLVKNESKGLITEWSNVLTMTEGREYILLLLGVALIVLFFIFKSKQFLYGIFTLVLLYGTYDTIRLTPFLLTVVLGALVFWEHKTFSLSKFHPRIASLEEMAGTLSLLMVLASIVISVGGVINLSRAMGNDESMFYVTSEELSLIPENARAAVTQDSGSAIILYRPDVLVTLDGRNDLIGAERFVEAANILYSDDSDEIASWLDEHDITAVFVADSSTDGAVVIASNMKALGWSAKSNGTRSVVYVEE